MYTELNRSDFYWIGLKKAFKMLLALLGLFLVGRLIFTFYFASAGVLASNVADVFYAYFMGVRYDLIVISYFLLPFLLLNTICSLFKNRKLGNALNIISLIYFYIVAIFVIAIIVCDLGFYSFFQDHLNILFFGLLEDDTTAIFTSIWKNYPVIWLSSIVIAFFILLFKFVKSVFKPIGARDRGTFNAGALKFIVLNIITLILLAGGIRGGYNWYVLSPKYNDFSSNFFVNQIALNGFITFEKAFKLRMKRNNSNFKMYKAMGYKNISAAFEDYLGAKVLSSKPTDLINSLFRKTPLNEDLKKKPQHVVFILAESYGAFWNQYNTESFNFIGDLKEHFDQDFYFDNFISSHNGTIGSLITTQSSIPDRRGQRYLSESKYMNTPIRSSVNVPFQESGYEATFIYGGKLAWRDVGSYFRSQGYDRVIGENQVVNDLELTGDFGTEWGIFDEHLYAYAKKLLKDAKKPQFIFILTTSNHPPFQYPKAYSETELIVQKELGLRLERDVSLFEVRFKSFRYANDKIAQFISEVKNSNLKDKTVISMSGDHNFFNFISYEESERFKMYKVPFYLYLPESLRPSEYNPSKFGSHEDIFSTIYPLVLSDTNYINFGDNLFSNEESIGINSKIYTSNAGVLYGDKKYSWEENFMLKRHQELELDNLKKYKRSIQSVTDYFLNYEYENLSQKSNSEI